MGWLNDLAARWKAQCTTSAWRGSSPSSSAMWPMPRMQPPAPSRILPLPLGRSTRGSGQCMLPVDPFLALPALRRPGYDDALLPGLEGLGGLPGNAHKRSHRRLFLLRRLVAPSRIQPQRIGGKQQYPGGINFYGDVLLQRRGCFPRLPVC